MCINILILPLYFNKSSKAEYEHNITIIDIIGQTNCGKIMINKTSNIK
jgi:hypothetical protein